MNTLQIGNDWPSERVGGLNRYYTDLLKSLPGLNVGVKGLVVGPEHVARQSGGLVSAFSSSGAPLYQRLWRVRQAVRQEFARNSIDLLVSHFALYAAPLGGLAKEHPLVVHFHGPWAAESDVEGANSLSLRMKFQLERSVYRRGRRFIVLSTAFQRELVRRFGLNEELVRVVPGGIDADRFQVNLTRTQAREQLGWPTDRPVLLAVRRIVRRMGLENLIDAMQDITAAVPEALLLLGGKGPLTEDLQRRITEKNLGANVRLLGRIEESDLALAYRAADLTVVPSQALEGFGMITLESLASGTPVFVTPVGGLPEVVQPFSPDCVFPDTEASSIGNVLADVLKGARPLPSENACRRYAVEHFSWPTIASRVKDVYTEALGSPD